MTDQLEIGWHRCGYTKCAEQVLGRRKYCSANCRAYAHRDGLTKQKATKAKSSPCDGCMFDRPCAGSERGRMCLANWRACNPSSGFPRLRKEASA